MSSRAIILQSDKKIRIDLIVNGNSYDLLVSPHDTLLEILRDRLGLTGTKHACGTGECCACTVLVNGEPMLACLTLVADLEGSEITTVEGLAEGEHLNAIQESFVEKGAIQCGYCTPGFLMAVKALLNENPNPSESYIRWYLRGNLCRCTGYAKIIEASLEAAKRMKGIDNK
jgi:carbon-monoxide dehydrogenase small subunit